MYGSSLVKGLKVLHEVLCLHLSRLLYSQLTTVAAPPAYEADQQLDKV